jgi:hypothetical protein
MNSEEGPRLYRVDVEVSGARVIYVMANSPGEAEDIAEVDGQSPDHETSYYASPVAETDDLQDADEILDEDGCEITAAEYAAMRPAIEKSAEIQAALKEAPSLFPGLKLNPKPHPDYVQEVIENAMTEDANA